MARSALIRRGLGQSSEAMQRDGAQVSRHRCEWRLAKRGKLLPPASRRVSADPRAKVRCLLRSRRSNVRVIACANGCRWPISGGRGEGCRSALPVAVTQFTLLRRPYNGHSRAQMVNCQPSAAGLAELMPRQCRPQPSQKRNRSARRITSSRPAVATDSADPLSRAGAHLGGKLEERHVEHCMRQPCTENHPGELCNDVGNQGGGAFRPFDKRQPRCATRCLTANYCASRNAFSHAGASSASS